MSKFEYKVLPISVHSAPAEIETKQNELGQQGWELVSVYQSGMNMNHYFKRELITKKHNGNGK